MVAFVLGNAATDLVGSTVDSIVMPLLSPVLPGETWQEAVWVLGPVKLGIGSFTAAAINFTVIALVMFWFVKLANKAKIVGKNEVKGIKMLRRK